MADLEVVLEYEGELRDIRPEKVLRAAALMLRVLREIERNLTGKKSRLRIGWRVNVYMLTGRAVITFDSVGEAPRKHEILEKAAAQGPPKVDLGTP